MSIKSEINDNLSKLLFLPINKNTRIGTYKIPNDVYLPIKSEQIIEKVKQGDNFDNIPFSYFIEGIFYVLGADENFRYNESYLDILKNVEVGTGYIKSKIFDDINSEKYEEAYIMLKGLINIEENYDNYDKVLLILDKLRTMDKNYEDEELKMIEKAKLIDGCISPYLYEALICRDNGDFTKAMYSLNTYINLGGVETKELSEFKENLKSINNYEKGLELIYEEPKEALKILIPLTDVLGDSAEIYYYIAIAYRNLEIYEKAIYYLNQASAVDDALIEVVNEYGINYACMGDYETAANYLEKAFKASQSIEICTNLIMCFINMKKYKDAKKYLEDAEKLNSNDEIVIQLKDMLKNVSYAD